MNTQIPIYENTTFCNTNTFGALVRMRRTDFHKVTQRAYTYISLQLSTEENSRTFKGKGKGKVHPRTGHDGPEGEQMYSSALTSTSALDGGGWSTPRPGLFTTRERPGAHCIGGLVGPTGPVWTGAG